MQRPDALPLPAGSPAAGSASRRRGRRSGLFLLVALLLLSALPAGAALIQLADGTRIQGEVVAQGRTGFRVRTDRGMVNVRWSEVEASELRRLNLTLPEGARPAASVRRPDRAAAGGRAAAAGKRPQNTLAFLLFAGVVVSVWFALLAWVEQDGLERGMRRGPWNTFVLITLGLGVAPYLIVRRPRREKVVSPAATLTHAEAAPAGGAADRGGLGGKAPKSKRVRGADGTEFRVPDRGFARRIELVDEEGNPIDEGGSRKRRTGLDNARAIIAQGIFDRASDIHLETREDGLGTRVRIDGILYERHQFTPDEGQRIISAIKSMAGVDVAERRKAQDGHFQIRLQGRQIDFRVATSSAIHGEKVVLRILDKSARFQSLDETGMSSTQQAEFKGALRHTSGMLLVVGPTGSGKTSTIYAALGLIDTQQRNVMTIEDPVEYELPNATQLQVNERAGITFESGLTSILRQDPDVILVGEIRNRETADIAVRASLTGHLVFSTLHSNNVENAIIRLREMGINNYHLASSLVCLIAQRLVRTLCPACKEPHDPTPEETAYLGTQAGFVTQVYSAVGCPACNRSGYLGRTGIFHIVSFSERLKKAVSDDLPEQEIHRYTRAGALGSGLRSDGIRKAREGITSLDEVRRVLGEE